MFEKILLVAQLWLHGFMALLLNKDAFSHLPRWRILNDGYDALKLVPSSTSLIFFLGKTKYQIVLFLISQNEFWK